MKLNSPKKKILVAEDFERYPVWTWDEEMEYVQPISESQPSVKEYVDLFIKAQFRVGSYEFDGYLMGGRSFYGFVIFIKNKKFMFNKTLPEINRMQLQELLQDLGDKHFDLFPTYYKSHVHLKEYEYISGHLDALEYLY